jgi:hypothetical protein
LLDDHDLPVKHETRRRGRPYTLVLTKTKTLFEREAVERKSWQAELAWLTKEAKSFGPRATRREARAVAAAAGPRARNPGARRRPGSDRARRSARS